MHPALTKTMIAKDREVERAIKNLARHGIDGAIAVLCSWISTKELKEMNDFWEKDDKPR